MQKRIGSINQPDEVINSCVYQDFFQVSHSQNSGSYGKSDNGMNLPATPRNSNFTGRLGANNLRPIVSIVYFDAMKKFFL